MTDNDKILTLFTTRVRQMILQYNELKKENEEQKEELTTEAPAISFCPTAPSIMVSARARE